MPGKKLGHEKRRGAEGERPRTYPSPKKPLKRQRLGNVMLHEGMLVRVADQDESGLLTLVKVWPRPAKTFITFSDKLTEVSVRTGQQPVVVAYRAWLRARRG